MIEQILVILETGGTFNGYCLNGEDSIAINDCANVEIYYRTSRTYLEKPVFKFLSRVPSEFFVQKQDKVSNCCIDPVNID